MDTIVRCRRNDFNYIFLLYYVCAEIWRKNQRKKKIIPPKAIIKYCSSWMNCYECAVLFVFRCSIMQLLAIEKWHIFHQMQQSIEIWFENEIDNVLYCDGMTTALKCLNPKFGEGKHLPHLKCKQQYNFPSCCEWCTGSSSSSSRNITTYQWSTHKTEEHYYLRPVLTHATIEVCPIYLPNVRCSFKIHNVCLLHTQTQHLFQITEWHIHLNTKPLDYILRQSCTQLLEKQWHKCLWLTQNINWSSQMIISSSTSNAWPNVDFEDSI